MSGLCDRSQAFHGSHPVSFSRKGMPAGFFGSFILPIPFPAIIKKGGRTAAAALEYIIT